MKNPLLILIAIILASPLWAADLKPQLTKAAKDLEQKANYSWTTTTKEADGSPGRLGPIDGKTDKEGIVFLSFAVGGIPVEVYLKGQKGAARALEGWMTLEEIAQTSGTAAAVVAFLKTYKTPAAQSMKLVGDMKEVQEIDGVLTGEMKEEATKEMLLFATRRREGQDAPKIADDKGSAKFWIKDAVLTKYEMKVQGKLTTGERTTDIDRTMTIDIKDIGSTKLEVPEEAKQKML